MSADTDNLIADLLARVARLEERCFESRANKKYEISGKIKYVYIEGGTVEAPSWANYIAMDKAGEWWAYEEKPVTQPGTNRWVVSNGRLHLLNHNTKQWKNSLQSV